MKEEDKMNRRTPPFLVFADLAFFLFSVVVMSYQYMEVVDSDTAQECVDSFLMQLPRLPGSNGSSEPDKQDMPPKSFTLDILADGTFRIADQVIPSEAVSAVIQQHSDQTCRLRVDRSAIAEHMVFILGCIEEHQIKGIEINFIQKDERS